MASNRNEYQEYFEVAYCDRCVGLRALPPSLSGNHVESVSWNPPGLSKDCFTFNFITNVFNIGNRSNILIVRVSSSIDLGCKGVTQCNFHYCIQSPYFVCVCVRLCVRACARVFLTTKIFSEI